MLHSDSNGQAVALVPFSKIANVLSVELHATVASLYDVEMTIGKLVGSEIISDTKTFMNLQKIDKITQTLHALADFIGGLAGHLPNDLCVDISSATRVILLEDISKKLRSCGNSGIPEGIENFDVDYFATNEGY